MAEDPFKRRPPVPKQRKPLLITKTAVDQIVSNAKPKPTEEEILEALKKDHEERLKASKALTALLRQDQQAGKEKLKKQYQQELGDLARETVQDVQMQARRDYVLDQAYRRLYHETDRVKHFKTAKELTEMLQKREEQIAAKASVKDRFAKYDAAMVIGMLRDVENFEEEEKEKKMAKREKMKVNAHNLSAQHQEKMQKKEEERWDNMKEGFLIRDEDARDHQADIAVKLHRLQQKQVYKKDLKEQLQVRMNLSNIKQRIAEAEEAKDKLFNDAKQAMKLEHKYNQEEADRKREAKKRAIADDLGDAAAVRRAKEAVSLEHAVRQAEEKAREDSILRQFERQEAVDAFLEHYSEEMAKKEKKEHDERLAGYQERRRIDENVERLEKEEKEKMFWREGLEKEAQHVQMHQIARKKGEEKGKKLEQIKDYMNHMRGLDEEEEVFQKYAKMEIEAAEAKGRNTLPMRKAAIPGIECGRGPLFEGRGHIRPRYYSAVANNPDDICSVKRKVLHSDTKYRLGFML